MLTGARFFILLYSTLLHLPPFRLHCVVGCWDRTQDCCDFSIAVRLFNHSARSHPQATNVQPFFILLLFLVCTFVHVYSVVQCPCTAAELTAENTPAPRILPSFCTVLLYPSTCFFVCVYDSRAVFVNMPTSCIRQERRYICIRKQYLAMRGLV